MPSDEPTTAGLSLTRKEAEMVVAGLTMLWNARRFARIDEHGDPYDRDLRELQEKLKRFSKSAFVPS